MTITEQLSNLLLSKPEDLEEDPQTLADNRRDELRMKFEARARFAQHLREGF